MACRQSFWAVFVGATLAAALTAAGPAAAGLFAGEPVHGFVEAAAAAKLSADQTNHDDFNLAEARLQLRTAYEPAGTWFTERMTRLEVKIDMWCDGYFAGKTGVDVRTLKVDSSLWPQLDVTVGRQVLTWGTGEYLFINDQFPKDYISFYTGREDEYLKKPNDALRALFYGSEVTIDMALIPVFTPNTVFDGERMSFYDPFQARISGRDAVRHLAEPARRGRNAELALRLYRTFGSYEAALYGFRGFYKNPLGFQDEAARVLFYPRLDVYGASLRGPGWGGVVNVEAGYYHSRQDSCGTDRLIQNSQAKIMMGYARDLGNDFSCGAQYLFEQTQRYDALLANRLPADTLWDKYRHLTTARLTKLFKQQTVRANFFVFFSPSDQDIYVRPSLLYDYNDQLSLSVGANLSWGQDAFTELGQAERNKNIYARVRYGF